MYFRTYRQRRACLDKYLESPVSEDPSKSSMVNKPKHCRNMSHSTFSIFFDQSKSK